MENKKKVLIIGRHSEILVKITELLKQHGYDAIGKMTNEEAFLIFQSETFDAVIIGGGVDAESRHLFHLEFPKTNPIVRIIDAHPETVLRDLQTAFTENKLQGKI